MSTIKYLLDKKRFKELQNEFKMSLEDDSKLPKWETNYVKMKYKEKGCFSLFIFIFYAIIRGKDHKKATHSLESFNYLKAISYLTDKPELKDYYFNSSQKKEISNLKKVFPSLTDSEIELVKNYSKENF